MLIDMLYNEEFLEFIEFLEDNCLEITSYYLAFLILGGVLYV